MSILPQFVATPETERVRRTETVFIYNGASVLGMNATLDLLAPGLHVTLFAKGCHGSGSSSLTRKSPEALEGEGLYV